MHPEVEFKRLMVRFKEWKKQFRDRAGATQKVGWGSDGRPSCPERMSMDQRWSMVQRSRYSRPSGHACAVLTWAPFLCTRRC